jgi:hypothetical protein
MKPKKNHQPRPTPAKTCVICGVTFNRKRRASGLMEHHDEYAKRRTCGRACGAVLSKRINTKPDGPPPCVVCGGSIPRRDGEPSHAWRARRTCSRACLGDFRAAAGRKTAVGNVRFTPEERRERDRARKRKRPEALPERRVAFERFPEPEGVKPTWTAAVGESLPAVSWERAGCPTRPPELTAAIGVHPDLATALAGALTDSWVPFSRSSGYAMHTERT